VPVTLAKTAADQPWCVSPSSCERDVPLVADVVARVGGHSIGASEVEGRMVADEVGAEAALEYLIDEALLTQEASDSPKIETANAASSA
jgi:hypothetical protein